MTRLEALRDLRIAVRDDDPLEAWPTPISADLIEAALPDDVNQRLNFEGAYSGSLTDAVALAEGMLPVLEWMLWMRANGEYACRIYTTAPKGLPKVVYAPTPARAMLLAVLDALIQKETGDG